MKSPTHRNLCPYCLYTWRSKTTRSKTSKKPKECPRCKRYIKPPGTYNRRKRLAKKRKETRAWRIAHKDEINEKTRKERMKLRKAILKMYGMKCSCCGESEERFLNLHHVDGRQKRDQISGWKDALKARDKTRYQVLCYNCHLGAHHHGGICPHKEAKKNEL